METRPSLQERVLAKIREAERLIVLCKEAKMEPGPLSPMFRDLLLQWDHAAKEAIHWTRIAIQTLPDSELDAFIEEVNEAEGMDVNWRESRLFSLAGTRWEHWSLAEWMDQGQTSEL